MGTLPLLWDPAYPSFPTFRSPVACRCQLHDSDYTINICQEHGREGSRWKLILWNFSKYTFKLFGEMSLGWWISFSAYPLRTPVLSFELQVKGLELWDQFIVGTKCSVVTDDRIISIWSLGMNYNCWWQLLHVQRTKKLWLLSCVLVITLSGSSPSCIGAGGHASCFSVILSSALHMTR